VDEKGKKGDCRYVGGGSAELHELVSEEHASANSLIKLRKRGNKGGEGKGMLKTIVDD